MRWSSLFIIVGLLVAAYAAAAFAFPQAWNMPAERLGLPTITTPSFVLGLDLRGGVHLVYEANLDEIPVGDREDSMQGVRDVIERRVNMFGVTEPVVQIDQSGDIWRLIVELPGVDDVEGAIATIGETPHLEFRKQPSGQDDPQGQVQPTLDTFVPTGLTGRHLDQARLEFDPTTNRPLVTFDLTDEGADLFADITRENIGRIVAIFLDGQPISAPVVQNEITAGQAQITGDFTPEEARQLVQRLNAGALPVPISLVQQNRVGPTLGERSLQSSVQAAIWGLALVALFMVAWYRLPGLFAVVALAMYLVFVLALFKAIPVTLTLSGIAGFLLSAGMAVDANVLIFERMKEERERGREPRGIVEEGFARAWPSIRDGNASTFLTALVLYIFGTSIVKGFALTLMVGVAVSIFTAVVITRTFLRTRYR